MKTMADTLGVARPRLSTPSPTAKCRGRPPVDLGLKPATTPIENPQSNGMAEALVQTLPPRPLHRSKEESLISVASPRSVSGRDFSEKSSAVHMQTQKSPYQISRSLPISRMEYLLILTMAGLLFLQPLFVRVAGLSPLLLTLIVTITYGLIRKPNLLSPPSIIILFLPISQILYGLSFGAEIRFGSYLILLIFLALNFSRSLDTKQSEKLWNAIGFVCLALTIIGIYRFVFGYSPSEQVLQEYAQGTRSENEEGALDAVYQYVYLGISYLPSTRNSDAFYFGVAALVFLSRIQSKSAQRPWQSAIFVGCFIISSLAVAFSLSRGVWISAALAVALVYGLRTSFSLASGAAGVLVVASVVIDGFDPSNNFVVSLLSTGFQSIFDPDGANLSVDGFYTYSNDTRAEIYRLALIDILAAPFGNGVLFTPSYGILTGAQTVHSENVYLDILIISGVFGLFLIATFLRKCFQVYQFRHDTPPVGTSLLLFCAFYSLFNSGIDFAPLWLVATVSILTVNSQWPPARANAGRLNRRRL